jgi:hypothetical protein
MLALHVNRNLILKLDLEVEEIYVQLCAQHKQMLQTLHDNCEAVEFLRRIQPKLHRVAQELHETPQITLHQFVRDNFKLNIERDSQNPPIFQVSLQQ